MLVEITMPGNVFGLLLNVPILPQMLLRLVTLWIVKENAQP